MKNVKLSDFGFSKTLPKKNSCRTLCGTPGYLAPEILERWPSYDVNCDTFSFGVIMFLLLGGYLPFDPHGNNDINKVFDATRNGKYHFFPQRWKEISFQAKDLVAKCLAVAPGRRLSSKKALEHEWIGNQELVLPSKNNLAVSIAETVNTVNTRRERAKKAAAEKVGKFRVFWFNRFLFFWGSSSDLTPQLAFPTFTRVAWKNFRTTLQCSWINEKVILLFHI